MRKLIAAGLFGATLAPAGLASETSPAAAREGGERGSGAPAQTDRPEGARPDTPGPQASGGTG